MDFKSKKVVSKFGPNDMQLRNPHDVAVTSDGNEIYVAELNPTRIYKFLHKSVAKSMPISAAKPTANTDNADTLTSSGTQHSAEALSISKSSNKSSKVVGEPAAVMDLDQAAETTETHHRPGATAILVASLMLLFAFLTFGLALLIARRRKRGMDSGLSVGQPSELVYRKLVASSAHNICDDSP